MENWGENEWQGRRKDQVEYANAVSTAALILLIVTVLVTFILI